MKKKIIAALSVALVTLLLLALLQAVLMPKYIDNPEGTLVGDYYDEAGGNDVLFLGDCEVYESFIPALLFEEYGITSYVRGSAQQLVWQSYYLLEEMLRCETPRAVVFNVYAMKYGEPQSDSYNRMTLDGMRWSSSKVGAISASMTDEEHFLEYVFPLLRFHSRISELSGEDLQYAFGTKYVSHSGYLMQKGVVPMTTEREGEDLFDYTLPETAFDYLDMMRKLCEEKGVELILVKAPTNHWKFWWYDEYDDQIKSYADTHALKYINFIPLCDEIGIDFATDTYDAGMHINVYGAEKLTRYFGKMLSEEFSIPDRRSESETAALWSERIARYYADRNEE